MNQWAEIDDRSAVALERRDADALLVELARNLPQRRFGLDPLRVLLGTRWQMYGVPSRPCSISSRMYLIAGL